MNMRDLAIDVVEDHALAFERGQPEGTAGWLKNASCERIVQRLRSRTIAAWPELVCRCGAHSCAIRRNHRRILREALSCTERSLRKVEQAIASAGDRIRCDPIHSPNARLEVVVVRVERAGRLSTGAGEQQAAFQGRARRAVRRCGTRRARQRGCLAERKAAVLTILNLVWRPLYVIAYTCVDGRAIR